MASQVELAAEMWGALPEIVRRSTGFHGSARATAARNPTKNQ